MFLRNNLSFLGKSACDVVHVYSVLHKKVVVIGNKKNLMKYLFQWLILKYLLKTE